MTSQTTQHAIALLQAGNYPELERHCRRLLDNGPFDEDLAILLAMGLQEQQRSPEAVPLYRQIAATRPDVAGNWANLALALKQSGHTEEAEQAYRRALVIAPRNTSLLIDYGLLLLDMARVSDARHRFLDAVDIDPDHTEARIYASLACFECGDAQRASILIPDSAQWPALSSDLREELASALIHVGRVEEAEALLDAPDVRTTVSGMLRLAQLKERTNRTEESRTLLNLLDPSVAGPQAHQEHVEILQLRAMLALRAKDYSGAGQAALAILDASPSQPAEINALFTLAIVADKQRDPETAMRHLGAAHDIRFRQAATVVPEIANSAAEPLRISSRWLTAGWVSAGDLDRPSAKASPVFIVGFPRSGTTMLEQMLDAHPAYASMDERAILQRCIEGMEAWDLAYPEDLGRLDARQIDLLRQIYWTEVSKVITLQHGQQLVDKNPLNMLRLPMILRLFPNAKIILALRHPCDVLLSCYMQNFRSPAFMVLCSSLERLAKSYVNAMRFWIHHQALLSPDTLVLRYEDTVGDFPAQVDRIGAFLGIEDRDFLAQFSEHAARKGYISTPSYSQVVEPVNTRAVGRWQPYARWLAPALPILQPVADHWGYDLTVR